MENTTLQFFNYLIFCATLIAVSISISTAIDIIAYNAMEDSDNANTPTDIPVKSRRNVTFGAIIPKTIIITRSRNYKRMVNQAVEEFNNDKNNLFRASKYDIKIYPHAVDLLLDPSPTDVLNALCIEMLPKNVVAIVYPTNSEIYGSNAASAQYLLQLTGYLGIPVIAWNADNIGLERNQRLPGSQVLQLAPSVEHQASAMLSILQRYSWHKFAIVTSEVGGHDDFVRAVRDQVLAITDFKFNIMEIYTLRAHMRDEVKADLESLAESEAHVMLLYCNKEEAINIMRVANDLGLTGRNYVWVVTQAVIGINNNAPAEFPMGMLGIYYNSTDEDMKNEVTRSVAVLRHGLELFFNDPRIKSATWEPNISCSSEDNIKWPNGDVFFKHLQNVNVFADKRRIAFNLDGTLRYVEFKVLNLNKMGVWEQIGLWTVDDGLDIKDIIWPGDSPFPPPGVPEKFNLKITFMEEPPYINIIPPDNETGECKTSRSVRCKIAPEADFVGVNFTVAMRNPKYYMCCSGFCVDLLEKFANDLGFTYELYRVEDGVWGVLENNTWNGLISEILRNKADMIVTSVKINKERQTAVDFTVPFMETGIAIVVAKKTGIISPKAFLEPFDTTSWLMILLVSIQVSALAIFLFEWLSPSGYDMKRLPPREHRFSLCRTYWLVCAILFGAAVNVDCPRGYTARFMSNVWAMFAVVFLAIYTANLAAFMITREEFYDLTGIEDERLYNPRKTEPPFRYGTIPYGNTEAVLRENKPEIFNYMKKFKKKTVSEGIKAVKTGELDAFIYDATVLEYLVGQDNECRLLTVGSWYAMTGYGFAAPKKSKFLHMFNAKMIEYRDNGDIERLQRFWLQGVCKPQNQKRNASNPLDYSQFMSAFLLLGCGVLFTLLLLGLEHVYFLYVRKHLEKKDDGGCCTLVSLTMFQSMGKSLSFRGAVFQAQDLLKNHRCKDPVCDTQLWKIRHQLDMARMRIQNLEKQLKKTRASSFKSQTKDMTRNHTATNEPTNLMQVIVRPPMPVMPYKSSYTEIAEIETVL